MDRRDERPAMTFEGVLPFEGKAQNDLNAPEKSP
jgi:hypothetical protein